MIGLVALDVIGSQLWANDGIAHIAHVGGALFGYLFFRVQSLSRRAPAEPTRTVERVVMVQSGSSEPQQHTPITPMRPAPGRIRPGGGRGGPGPRQDQPERDLQPHPGRTPVPRRSGKEEENPPSYLSSYLFCISGRAFLLSRVLINLLPDFLSVLEAPNREAAYRQYRETIVPSSTPTGETTFSIPILPTPTKSSPPP